MKLKICIGIIAGLSLSAKCAYTTVESSSQLGSSVRYKRLDDGQLCNGGRESYTGWVDNGDRHFFYWYHPVQTKEPAPLMFWFQGGPGGASVEGMLMENGPCLLPEDKNETVRNPYSWTKLYNIIYIDQPLGVGYSYLTNQTDHAGTYPKHADESALDFVSTVRLLLEAFTNLQSLPIYLSGESFGGRYVPVYGAAILDYNSRVPASAQIQLVSIMVGNGLTSPADQYPAIYDVSCYTHDGIPPIFNASECSILSSHVDRCEKLARRCESTPDEIVCLAAAEFCGTYVGVGLLASKLNNRYNRAEECPAPGQCYNLVDQISEWMNTPHVRNVLEIDNQTANAGYQVKFSGVNVTTFLTFNGAGESAYSSVPSLVRILEAGVQVLYYAGVNDWICNSVGIKRALENVYWSRHAEFRALPMTSLPWNNKEGQGAGQTKAVDGLHWVELTGGGHIIPYDQPESTFNMIRIWRDRVEEAMGNGLSTGPSPGSFAPSEHKYRLPNQSPLHWKST